MSHTHQLIFTDAIKDVIGDEPVLDQYDISYVASFYGTMQDDFVTGTMLTQISYATPQYLKANTTLKKLPVFSTGSQPRGRLFSKFYSDGVSPLRSDYGSTDVNQIPALSYRLVPWHNRISRTAYRIVQCFDSNERYYDSCLPDLPTCFAANGSQVWTTSNDPTVWLSPYGNVVTQSVGYMFFNSLKSDRSANGFSTDPMVNNDWTWSYPYENKYSPGKRIVKTTNALGLDQTRLTTNWAGAFFTDLTQSSKPKNVSGIIPFLPGYIEPNIISSAGGRNSLRQTYVVTGSSGPVTLFPGTFDDPVTDSYFGISYTIPADVQLNHLVSHDFLDPWIAAGYGMVKPVPEPFTGTMSTEDTVKFLFGFGDLNNMTWSSQLFNSSSLLATGSKYGFEYVATALATGTVTRPPAGWPQAYELSKFDNGHLKIDWTSSPTSKPWSVYPRIGSFYDNTTLGSAGGYYNYLSASSAYVSNPASNLPPLGMFWLSSSSPSDAFVLLSDTITSYKGDVTSPDASYSCVDITSSFPWALKYKRGLISSQMDYFASYFTGIPEIPSGEWFGGLLIPIPDGIIEIKTGSIISSTVSASGSYSVISQYDSRVDGFGRIDFYNNTVTPYDYPLNPGAYRIVFEFARTGILPPGSASIAALSDLEIVQYGTNSFTPNTNAQKLGANNYPNFQQYRVDSRYCPIKFPGYTNFMVTGSANNYKAEVFGVSPVIRGWKYGLYSGLPMHSKAVFRRNRYGQLRDMLEQRQYTKFIMVNHSPVDDDAITRDFFSKDNETTLTKVKSVGQLGPAVAEVNFVRQQYKKDERGIGYIYNEKVDPAQTISQNLSVEVTSSLPFFDGIAKLRQESELTALKAYSAVSVSITTSGLTVG
jgi:hypothetical protein